MSIHGLYGLAHLGLSNFHNLCKEEKLSYSIVRPGGLEKKELGEKLSPYPIVIVSVIQFLKVYKKIQGKPSCVFIVDNPIQLESVGAKILGCSKQNSYHYTFHPVEAKYLREIITTCSENPLEIKFKKTKVIYELLKLAASESLLAPVQTTMYQIKDPVIRTEIQDIFFDWLAGSVKTSKMEGALGQVKQSGIGDKLKELAGKEKFVALRKAATAVLKGKENYEDAVKKFNIPMYDLKYLCKKQVLKYNITIPS